MKYGGRCKGFLAFPISNYSRYHVYFSVVHVKHYSFSLIKLVSTEFSGGIEGFHWLKHCGRGRREGETVVMKGH